MPWVVLRSVPVSASLPPLPHSRLPCTFLPSSSSLCLSLSLSAFPLSRRELFRVENLMEVAANDPPSIPPSFPPSRSLPRRSCLTRTPIVRVCSGLGTGECARRRRRPNILNSGWDGRRREGTCENLHPYVQHSLFHRSHLMR